MKNDIKIITLSIFIGFGFSIGQTNSEQKLKESIHNIDIKIEKLKIEKDNYCNRENKIQADLNLLDTKVKELKTTKGNLEEKLEYVEKDKYKNLIEKIIKLKNKKEKLYAEYIKNKARCQNLKVRLNSLNVDRKIALNKLKNVQIENYKKLLTREEWVIGEGVDILDIDETVKQCENNAIKYAEQNAINSKFGVLSSIFQSNKEIIKDKDEISINKEIYNTLKNSVKVIKIDEKILEKTRKPTKIDNINTFLCKAKVKLKVKGIFDDSQLKIPTIKKESLKFSNKRDIKSYSKNKKPFKLGNFGIELNFGYGFDLYNFGKQSPKNDGYSTLVGLGFGYIFFNRIYIGTGLGNIQTSIKTDYQPISTSQEKTLRDVSINTNFYKFTMIIFPFHSKEGYFLRSEYIGSQTQIGEKVKFPGKGFIIGVGKKVEHVALEFRYTRTNIQNETGNYGIVNFSQYGLIFNIIFF